MIYAVIVLALLLLACGLMVLWLVNENDDLKAVLSMRATDLHYLRERNRVLNAELMTYSRTALYDDRANAFAAATKTASTASLPPEHPQRKPKSIRGKKKP